MQQEGSGAGRRRNIAAIQKALKKGDAVTLVGFGTFGCAREKPARAETPRRAQPSRSPQRRFRYLKAGKGLKDTVK